MVWGYNLVSPYSATCSRTTANIGDTVYIRASGSGGTPNYTAYFSQSGGVGSLSQTVVSGLGEGIQTTVTYTVQSGDAGKTIVFSSYVVDSCASGAKTSPSQTCSVSVSIPCNTPVCNFSIE